MSVDAREIEAALSGVRSLILGHGGNVRVLSAGEDGVVEVELIGACRACPNLAMTFVGPLRSALIGVKGIREVRCRQVHASQRTLARMARLLGAAPIDIVP
jgi:Fe-S cluster biogenesis protein NfuA